MKTFILSEEKNEKLIKALEKADGVPAPENSLGQWIGYFIDNGTSALLEEICLEISEERKVSIEALSREGHSPIRLKNSLGQLKQIDHALKVDSGLVLIVESKWLKDQRHLNDKGSWVLMMNSILRVNRNLKGIIAVLAGPWEGMRDVIEKIAEAVIVPTKKVYQVLTENGVDIEIDVVRNAYKEPGETLSILLSKIEERRSQGRDFLKEVGYDILKDYKDELKEKISSLLFTS